MQSTAQRKEHSKTEFGKKNSENKFGELETFYRSKFGPATGVTLSFCLTLSLSQARRLALALTPSLSL